MVDVAVADKIASLRHALLTGTPLSATASCATTRITLQLALTAGLATGLCKQLDELIARRRRR